ncbi:hypothetical protein PXNS11_60228 [Stutzerimonas xanthomarina]|nr:hypothetical protein PXNS11_60228 [Stutzerimonas xanthomarina]
MKRESLPDGSFHANYFSPSGVYKAKPQPYSSRPQCLADVVTRKRLSIIVSSAQVAELVDALGSGPSGGNTVEVRVFSWAPLIQMKPAATWRVSCKTKKPTSADLIGEMAKSR